VEEQFLSRVRKGLDEANFWIEHSTAWVCLDCELMPWSAKAQELLRSQYAAVGAAGEAALPHAIAAVESARQRLNGEEQNLAIELLGRLKSRQASVAQFVNAYREYCWPVNSVDDLQLAPFHILATEGKVHTDRDHVWHMDQIANICASDHEFLLATPYKIVDLLDSGSEASAINWWLELTGNGGEGMVVKPLNFIARSSKELIQPAIKCRGREYLRIIYGPEYTAEENLARLRSRGLNRKRSLARREFALGVEGLERFIKCDPLRRVHECVFGVLALESEPVDPRL
jgi:protein phosphatase